MGRRSVWLLVLLLGISEGFAQRIPVREAAFQIYEKELEGFEILLPATVAVARDSLVAHLERHTSRIAVFEDMILVEEARYAPISIWQPITMMFLVESQGSQISRIRAGALVNYRQSITIPQAPDMALRLLLDLDQYCRETTGDSLDFDLLFQRISAQDLVHQFEARQAGYKWNLHADRKPEEVVDEAGLRLRNKTGLTTEDPAEVMDREIVEEVSRRFQVYVQGSESSAFVPQDQQAGQALLMDSIAQLSQQLSMATAQLAQYRDQQDSTASLPASVVQATPAEVVTRIIRDTIIITDTVAAAVREAVLVQESQALQQQLLAKDQELGVVFSRMERLERELDALKAGQQADVQPEDSLLALRQLLEQAEDDHARRLARYETQTDSLQELITTLNPESEQSKARRAIYLRQLNQLQEAQQTLVERGWNVTMREKRVGQREQFLAEQEKEADIAAMLQRIADLEQELARGQANEQQQAAVIIEPGRLRIGEEEIPAFSLRTSLPASWAKEQLLAWARVYDLRVKGDEVLLIQSDNLPGMEGPRYDWQTTLLERESGAILYATFRTHDGRYLNFRDGSLESRQAIRLLQEVFR